MLRRGILLSPTEGGGEEAKEAPAAPVAPAKKSGPDPVPYDVFRETNEKLRAAEQQASKLQSKIDGFVGWKAPQEIESLLAAERSRGDSLLLLADKGVAPKYRGYMLDRLGSESPEDPGAFLDSLRESETAFFVTQGSPVPASPVVEQKRTPPRSNPDGAAGSAAPGDGRPISAADINAMSVEEYAAWKAAGGLSRLRSSGAL
jgi:hypothetical protein